MISIDEVLTQLRAYGYKDSESDGTFILLAINGAETYIKNFCHTKEVPEELKTIAIEMAAGTLLRTKLSIGEKVNDLVDFEACNVASVTEGDVSVSYNNGGDNNSVAWFTGFLDRLCNRDNELLHFRKLRW